MSDGKKAAYEEELDEELVAHHIRLRNQGIPLIAHNVNEATRLLAWMRTEYLPLTAYQHATFERIRKLLVELA